MRGNKKIAETKAVTGPLQQDYLVFIARIGQIEKKS